MKKNEHQAGIRLVAGSWMLGLTFLCLSFIVKSELGKNSCSTEIDEQSEYVDAMPFPLLPALEVAARTPLKKLRALSR